MRCCANNIVRPDADAPRLQVYTAHGSKRKLEYEGWLGLQVWHRVVHLCVCVCVCVCVVHMSTITNATLKFTYTNNLNNNVGEVLQIL